MSYCGEGQKAIDEVIRLCGQTVTIGTGRADVLDSNTVEKFMADADELINGKLNQIYYVPLRKVTRGGSLKYPDPIARIAKYLTASNLIMTYFKEIAPNESAAVKTMKEEALFSLNRVIDDVGSGSERLEGQKQKARNRFGRPTIFPSKPPTPISGPAGGVT